MNSSAANTEPVICEVCGAYFENRRGLSSHARLHLRQLGMTVTENSGSPIELLYQLIEEKNVSPEDSKMDNSASVSTPPKKADGQLACKTSLVQEDIYSSTKMGGRVLSKLQKSDHQGSPSRLKEQEAPLLHSSASAPRPSEGSSSSFSDHQTKPMWAPSDTDAPITLASVPNDEVHVCQLCGSWYETRKGLASHARAHLRQIGIPDSELKSSPIEYLYQIMEEQDLKPISVERQEELKPTSPSKSSKRPIDVSSCPASTPGKRSKTSEDFTCVLCGEEFENRKGLGSHARSHLRHIGVSDLVGKSSAIGAVEELVSSGMLEPVRPSKPNSAASSSTAPSPAPPSPVVPVKQSKTVFSPMRLSPSPTSSQSPQPSINRAPKAKKGFRLAVDPLHRKPKPEPIETEVFVQPKPSNNDNSSSMQKLSTTTILKKPSDSDVQSPPTVLCDFCGQLFDTRKALSCHVRAHLRHLGLTWSIRTSPIDLLREVMMQREDRKESERSESSVAGKAPWRPQGSRRARDSLLSVERAYNSNAVPVDYSMKDKSPSKSRGANLETSCELCGFDFENRKALASHARAHLRQLGIFEWRADGARSPIELLSELIRRDPNKVEEITRRYRFGDLYIKKSQRSAALTSASTDPDGLPRSSQKSSLQHHERKASRMDHSSISARTSRGVHAPKHGVSSGDENWGTNSRHPPRSGSIPALLPKPPLTPLVKLVGKIYSLKCRFCEEVFHGPLSVQEKWIAHLQKHILSLGYKGKEAPPSPPATPAPPAPSAVPAASALVDPVAV